MASHLDWRQARRERTRLLIDYGNLVVRAGLADCVEDDRATLLGGLLGLRELLDGVGDDAPADLRARWRQAGLRVLDADAADKRVGKEDGADDPDHYGPDR